MSLEIVHHEREGIAILDLKGRLTFGEEDLQFRNELEQLISGNKTRVVLILENLSSIDTTALGTLLYAQETLHKAGGGLALAALQPSHIEILMKAKLEVVFNVFADDLDAVNSFFPDRKVAHYDVLEFVREAEHEPPSSNEH